MEAVEAPRLSVRDLAVTFDIEGNEIAAVRGVSFDLRAGETLAIVGESGSGKTQIALALGRLTSPNARVSGTVRLEGRDISGLGEAQMQRLRGARIAYIFQDPISALNPYLTIGAQLTEAVRVHEGLGRAQARARALEVLEQVRMPDPAKRLRQHPHELSGGMRQRVMIAMALSCRPALLVADEPTTALDVTIQAQILDLLDELRRETGTSILLITHDMGVVARLADHVAVMYAGRIVESAPADVLFAEPHHPYTHGLMASMPRVDSPLEAELIEIPGLQPDPTELPIGCAFAPRCPHAFDACSTPPELRSRDIGHREHRDACHLHVPPTGWVEGGNFGGG